jgi:cytochrome c
MKLLFSPKWTVLFFVFFILVSCQESKVYKSKTKGKNEYTTLHPGAIEIAKHDCKTCHNKNLASTGPSFKMIANKYPNTPENVTYLIGKIRKGGSGVWGSKAMAAHPDIPEDIIREMVGYIMTLDSL